MNKDKDHPGTTRFLRKKTWVGLVGKLSGGLNLQAVFPGRLAALIFFLCCITLNVYVRLFPAYFPALKKEAVLNAVNAFSEKVSKEYKGPQDKMVMNVLDQVGRTISRDPKVFNEKVVEEYAKLKDPYQDESGLTYLMEFDPYTWARWTENVVKNGHPGDITRNGKSFDTTLLAPLEVEVFHYRLLFYLTAFLYQGVHGIEKGISLPKIIFFIPVFYASCFLSLFFFFVRKWSNNLTAFLAVFSVGFAGVFLMRSSAGWYDFDMLSPFMALLVAWPLIESLKAGQHWGTRIFFAFLAAFCEGSYAMVWMGWWFMLIVAGGCFFLAGVSAVLCNFGCIQKMRNEVSVCIVCACIFFIGASLSAYILAGVNIFERFFWLKDFLHFGTIFSADIWPNTLFVVGETRPVLMHELAQRFYTPCFFYAAILSMLFALFYEFKTERRNMIFLMLCWFLFMFVASLNAHRFIAYLVIPWGLFFALGLGEYLPKFIQQKLYRSKKIGGFLVYLILIGFVIQTVFKSGTLSAEALRPVVTDAWRDALKFVEKNTPKNAIINSNWDYASWFCYFGKRKVIFDGQFHYTPISYWMARVFLEKDEEKAVRILRLLNNSSYKTYEKLLKQIKEPFLCETILEKLLTVEEDEGKRILAEHGLPKKESEEITDALYANPPPAYLLVDGGLWAKIPSISILGRWDFQRFYALRNCNEPREKTIFELQNIYKISRADAEEIVGLASKVRGKNNTMKWVSRQSPFFINPTVSAREGEMVYFDYGFAFNPNTQDAFLYSVEEGKYKIPRKIVFFENGQPHVIKKENGDDDRVILLARQGDRYKSLVTDSDLADSLLVKLLFLDGEGLRRFRPFYSDEKNKIYIYKIEWASRP